MGRAGYEGRTVDTAGARWFVQRRPAVSDCHGHEPARESRLWAVRVPMRGSEDQRSARPGEGVGVHQQRGFGQFVPLASLVIGRCSAIGSRRACRR